MTRKHPHRIKLRSMYQWHRYTGVSIALFVIIVSVTGILLNHTDYFKLSTTYVQQHWLLNWYGIRPPEKIISYSAKNHWISQWDDRLFFNQHDLGHASSKLVGAVNYEQMIVIAQENSLLLVTPQGELIERISKNQGLPTSVQAIGLTNSGQVILQTSQGNFIADHALVHWQNQQKNTKWIQPRHLPSKVYSSMLDLYRGKGLPLERVMLDLHSGRLLGSWGVYFTDFIALLLIFLALSGVWITIMRQIKKRQHQETKRKNYP